MARKAEPKDNTDASGEFLRLMSHEMRTPLNGVIGMLGLLNRTRLDGAQAAYVNTAKESAEHLLGLVNDLLDYARLDAGSIEFETVPVDLETLVQGVAELLSPRAHEKSLEIVSAVDPDAPNILADDGRLRQVLFNLAGNAVKFTQKGGVRIAVERVGGSISRPRLRFVVEDTGPGVPEDARRRIFEQFGHVNASDASRFDGAGLGLAVVDRLAKAMDGKTGVEDRKGGGARFWFEAAFDRAPDKDTAPALDLEGQTVWIDTPNLVVRQAVNDQVIASRGTAKRVRSLDKIKDGVVLIDHTKADADELVEAPTHCPSIILLRPEERDLIAKYRHRGFCAYLIKPLRRASLVERVLAVSGGSVGTAPVREDDRIETLHTANLRVLLAEDNPVNALLAKNLLLRQGCSVETAATGQEALDALKRARYDLVFMDMRMPGMDGLDATRTLRARGDDTPVIALTANVFTEDRNACLAAGMNDHLAKPIDVTALRAAMRRWTNGQGPAKVAS